MSEQEIQTHQARLKNLTQALLQAAQGVNHSLLLDALMTLYVAVAESHSCCTRSAALICVSVASRLQNASLQAQRPQGIPLH